MIKSQSRTSFVRAWDRLLSALEAGEAEHPEIVPYRRLLEEHLEKVKDARRRQRILAADRVKATRELNRQMSATADTVRRVRNLLIALLGPRNERLLDFGIAVLRQLSSAETTHLEGKQGAPPATSSSR